MYGIWNRLQYMLSPQFDIYEQVSKIVSGRVADVGSGTGFGTHLLARCADRVRGYEVDTMARDFAQRAFSNGSIQFYELDICRTADVKRLQKMANFVTMIDVIEHIETDDIAIKNCKMLLMDNGIFICSTPNRLSRYRKSDYHVREYSPDELKSLLKSAFDNVEILDYQLKPIETEYANPIIGMCS